MTEEKILRVIQAWENYRWHGGPETQQELAAALTDCLGPFFKRQIVINPDLRNQDPDQIVAAFYKEIEQKLGEKDTSPEPDSE